MVQPIGLAMDVCDYCSKFNLINKHVLPNHMTVCMDCADELGISGVFENRPEYADNLKKAISLFDLSAMKRLKFPSEGIYGKFLIKRVPTRNKFMAMQGMKITQLFSTNPKQIIMTDSPQERWWMLKLAKKLKGRILIGGLGLGILPRLCSEPRGTVVVEIEPDIVDMMRESLPKHIEVVQDDIWNFLKTTEERFDSAGFDIWASGEVGNKEGKELINLAKERCVIGEAYYWGG